jgi:hypothetical protein
MELNGYALLELSPTYDPAVDRFIEAARQLAGVKLI